MVLFYTSFNYTSIIPLPNILAWLELHFTKLVSEEKANNIKHICEMFVSKSTQVCGLSHIHSAYIWYLPHLIHSVAQWDTKWGNHPGTGTSHKGRVVIKANRECGGGNGQLLVEEIICKLFIECWWCSSPCSRSFLHKTSFHLHKNPGKQEQWPFL